MDALSLYDPHRFDAETPANVRGGRARARTASRDAWGRFKPCSKELPTPLCHGRDGGVARAIKATRDSKGRFVKESL